MRLWLVGMMGSGKSTVGERVASDLGVPFHDTDAIIARREASTVASIWETHGEEHFRALESGLVAELAQGGQAVIATGGGVVLDPSNRSVMRSSGRVVWLRSSVDELVGRLPEDRSRPLLAGLDRRDAIEELLTERTGAYESAAHLVLDVDGLDVEEVARSVGAAWTR